MGVHDPEGRQEIMLTCELIRLRDGQFPADKEFNWWQREAADEESSQQGNTNAYGERIKMSCKLLKVRGDESTSVISIILQAHVGFLFQYVHLLCKDVVNFCVLFFFFPAAEGRGNYSSHQPHVRAHHPLRGMHIHRSSRRAKEVEAASSLGELSDRVWYIMDASASFQYDVWTFGSVSAQAWVPADPFWKAPTSIAFGRSEHCTTNQRSFGGKRRDPQLGFGCDKNRDAAVTPLSSLRGRKKALMAFLFLLIGASKSLAIRVSNVDQMLPFTPTGSDMSVTCGSTGSDEIWLVCPTVFYVFSIGYVPDGYVQ